MTEILSTSEVAATLGASEASVKRWADEGEFACERTPGGHRRFHASAVAAFAARLRGASGLADPASFAERALASDGGAIEAMLRSRWTSPRAIAAVADQLVRPALADVGARWAAGKLSVADEHVASATVRQALSALSDRRAPASLERGPAVIACPAGESHELGAVLVAAALRAVGFDARLTGADTPPRDLARLVASVKPRVVALSASGASGDVDVYALAPVVTAARRCGAELWVGGRGFAGTRLRGARVAGTLRELVDALEAPR